MNTCEQLYELDVDVVLNAAARLVYSRRMSEHTAPLLQELHWLRVSERIQFRLCVLAYHGVHGTAPAYLADSLRPTSDVVARRRLRSVDTRQPDAAGAINSSGNSRRPRVSCGCSAGMEQSASTDQDRLLSDNIPAPNQGLSFPSVIWLMELYHCPFSLWRTKPEHVFVLICVRCPRNVL